MPNQFERIDAAFEKVTTEVLPALLEKFQGQVEQIELTEDKIPQVYATPAVLKELALWLKDRGFNMLVDVGGVDYYPKRDPRFEVVYHFRQMPALGMIRVRVRVADKQTVSTLSDVWAIADPAEREIFDQFGITFTGHPNLKRILNPEDWAGYPLRKDYPIRGPRSLITLEMPADENRYAAFVDEESKDGK